MIAFLNTITIFQNMKKEKKALVPTPTKGKGGGKGSSNKSGGKQENMEVKECPLDFRQFDPLENHSAPRFFNVLKRPTGEGEGLGLEDLDGLQLELEALLSNVVLRKRHFKEELDIIKFICQDFWVSFEFSHGFSYKTVFQESLFQKRSQFIEDR